MIWVSCYRRLQHARRASDGPPDDLRRLRSRRRFMAWPSRAMMV